MNINTLTICAGALLIVGCSTISAISEDNTEKSIVKIDGIEFSVVKISDFEYIVHHSNWIKENLFISSRDFAKRKHQYESAIEIVSACKVKTSHMEANVGSLTAIVNCK